MARKENFLVSYVDFSEIEKLLENSVISSDSTYSNNQKSKEDKFDKDLLFKEMNELKKEPRDENNSFNFDDEKSCNKFSEKISSFFDKMKFHPRKIEKDGHVVIGITMPQGFENHDALGFRDANELEKARIAPSQGQEIGKTQKQLIAQKMGYKVTLQSLTEKLTSIEKDGSSEEVNEEKKMIENLIKEAKEKELLVEIKIEEEKEQELIQEQLRQEEEERVQEFFMLAECLDEWEKELGSEAIDKLRELLPEKEIIPENLSKNLEEKARENENEGRRGGGRGL